MNRMWDKNDLIKLIEEYAPGFDPSSIEEGNVPQGAVLGIDADGDIVKGNLFGKYVRTMPAPTNDVLTPSQISEVVGGVFIQGDFKGLHNPIIYPARKDATAYYGIIAGVNATGRQFRHYGYIITGAGQFVIYQPSLIDLWPNGALVIKEKTFPNYPENTDNKVFACVNGTLQWSENPLASVAPEYASTATYSVGALVIHEGLLYQCSTAVTVPEAWDAAKWTQTTLAAVIATL